MLAEWQLSIASADLADWITVLAYLIAAFLSARASRLARFSRKKRDRMFWRLTTILLIFFGINELLDLQALLTIMGREHAMANGWYDDRRSVQYYFVIALAVIGTATWFATLLLAKRTHASVRIAIFGLGFIGIFVLVRAASFHHLDDLLGGGFPLFNWGSVQEVMGIAITAVGALRYTRVGRSGVYSSSRAALLPTGGGRDRQAEDR